MTWGYSPAIDCEKKAAKGIWLYFKTAYLFGVIFISELFFIRHCTVIYSALVKVCFQFDDILGMSLFKQERKETTHAFTFQMMIWIWNMSSNAFVMC